MRIYEKVDSSQVKMLAVAAAMIVLMFSAFAVFLR